MIEASLIIQQSLVISLCVIAIWATMWEGMIFDFISKWGEDYLFENEQKIAFSCPICMCPYYGSVIYLAAFVLTIISAMGVNAILVKFLPENWYGE
mgnify:CR=1 FL=1